MKSVSHTYAETAYNCIRLAEKESWANEYGRLCLLFPSLLLTNGLRLTVAYYQGKGQKSESYKQFLNDMREALGNPNWENGLPANMAEYRELSRRALQAAVWFKRYAEAILKVETTDD